MVLSFIGYSRLHSVISDVCCWCLVSLNFHLCSFHGAHLALRCIKLTLRRYVALATTPAFVTSQFLATEKYEVRQDGGQGELGVTPHPLRFAPLPS